MRIRRWIGNDVVDLAEPGAAGKERDLRFMDRVFTAAERARITEAVSPTIAVWKTWAAKETAFKIASKLREGLVFAHRAFEVEPDSSDAAGRVRVDRLDVAVRWEVGAGYVHCVGWLADSLGLGWLTAGIVHERRPLDGVLSADERASVHSPASARARLLVRQLVERWGLQGAEVVRLRRALGWGPPLLVREGTPLGAFDVSLSHDGRFVAAAVAGPRPPSLAPG